MAEEKVALATWNGSTEELPLPTTTSERTGWRLWQKMGVVGVLVTLALLAGSSCCSGGMNEAHLSKWLETANKDKTDWVSCPHQPKALHPEIKWDVEESYRNHSAGLLSAAVQIPTQSFDDNGEPNEDPRWKPFFEFQHWLVESFPEVHAAAKVEYINTLGILLTLEGSDPSLKPLLLMSHYDVVPAPDNTLDRWTHGPFSGFNDGTFIWGRGATDDKTLLVAQYEALTLLIKAGFDPRRTVIFAHGFDEEEVSARRGAGHIAPFLEDRYGKDSLLLIIDEGSGTSDDVYGAPFALPVSGEKGYLDIVVTVGTTGGHSSNPPPHTGIGIMAQAINALEANPFPTVLTSASPYLTHLQCAAKHSPSFPSKLLKSLKHEGPHSWPQLAAEIGKVSPPERAIVSTTTAVDVIKGGVKVNALPEQVTAMVNFRIDFASNVKDTEEHVTKVLKKVAKLHDMEYAPFPKNSSEELSNRYIKIERFGEPLEPAPRSPQEGGVWDMFAGTIKAALPAPHGQERIVSPYASTGNTDCKMYYNLSKHVYRFMGLPDDAAFGMHTVDERSTIDGHVGIVRWIHAIIQNANAYEGKD